MGVTVTDEMRRAVRAEECVHGHSFETICAFNSGDPVRLVCTNCERSWNVQTNEPRIVVKDVAASADTVLRVAARMARARRR